MHDDALSLPRQILLTCGGRHAVRIVIIRGRQGSYVGLMVGRVEKMGKEPLFEFHKSEGDGKGRERLRKETTIIDELEIACTQTQHFKHHTDLMGDGATLVLQLL